MFALRISENRHRRSDHVGEHSHFAPVIHAGLHHCSAVAEPQPHERMGDADVVIEVSFGRKHLVRTPACAQNSRHHLSGGGFAVAAAHCGEIAGEAGAPGARNPRERAPRVPHNDLCGIRAMNFVLDHQTDGARFGSLPCIVVAVKALAGNGDENVAFARFAGIGCDPLPAPFKMMMVKP